MNASKLIIMNTGTTCVHVRTSVCYGKIRLGKILEQMEDGMQHTSQYRIVDQRGSESDRNISTKSTDHCI